MKNGFLKNFLRFLIVIFLPALPGGSVWACRRRSKQYEGLTLKLSGESSFFYFRGDKSQLFLTGRYSSAWSRYVGYGWQRTTFLPEKRIPLKNHLRGKVF